MSGAASVDEAPRGPDSIETILVVDDEVLIRMPISEYLRDCGYRVVEAVNGDEAIAVLTAADCEIDLISPTFRCREASMASRSRAG